MGDQPLALRRRSDFFAAPSDEDEISLIDLFRLLLTNKKLIILIACVITTIATAYALSKPKLYEYSVNIDIGSIDVSSASAVSKQPLDTPQNVHANLVNGYIPVVLEAYRQNNPDDTNGYKIEASIPKGSSIVQLKARGTEEQAVVYKQLMKQVVAGLVKDHEKKIASTKNQMKKDYKLAKLELSELEDATNQAVRDLTFKKNLVETQTKLEALQDPRLTASPRHELEKNIALQKKELSSLQEQEISIKAQLNRLDQSRDLLVKQITELDDQVQTALQQRQQAKTRIGDESRAMTMLMIDNEIQQNRDRLARLEERLYLGLENDREKLSGELNDNARSQQIQQQEIRSAQGKLEEWGLENTINIRTYEAEIALLKVKQQQQLANQQRAIARKNETIRELGDRLDNIQPTRAVTDIIASSEPVGAGAKVIILLGVVLGLMAGVFAAFAREFMRRVTVQEANPELKPGTAGVAAMPAFDRRKVASPLSREENSVQPLQNESA